MVWLVVRDVGSKHHARGVVPWLWLPSLSLVVRYFLEALELAVERKNFHGRRQIQLGDIFHIGGHDLFPSP